MKNKAVKIILCSLIFLGLLFFGYSYYSYANKTYPDVCIIKGGKDLSQINDITVKNTNDCFHVIYEIQEEKERQKHIVEEQDRIKNEYNNKIESIKSQARKEWFIFYKSILKQYKIYPYINIPLNVYDEYNINEIKVFQKLVAAETTGGNFESKCNVASVVWNRIHSQNYPDNIIDVIYERNGSAQFTPTYDGRIDIVEVTEDDVLAIEYTYMFGSTVYDCIAFDTAKGNSWNKNKLEMVFTDSINHTFYR